MVPIAAATSSTLISSSPWRPKRTTSSPMDTAFLTSGHINHTLVHADPSDDRRLFAVFTSTCPLLDKSLVYPSAYPMGIVAILLSLSVLNILP